MRVVRMQQMIPSSMKGFCRFQGVWRGTKCQILTTRVIPRLFPGETFEYGAFLAWAEPRAHAKKGGFLAWAENADGDKLVKALRVLTTGARKSSTAGAAALISV